MKRSNIFNWIGVLVGLLLFCACEKNSEVIEEGSVTDADGNIYTTVKIGYQIWMVENLKTTKYNDGTDIPHISDSIEWAGIISPGHSWYKNDIANKATYGALYNFYSVDTDKLAPHGWHVATNGEWEELIKYVGGTRIAGGKLKELGLAHWFAPNYGATNEYGFTALPGGFRHIDGSFMGLIYDGYWWTSTAFGLPKPLCNSISYRTNDVYPLELSKTAGLSVRCVKD
ncbi:MAG: fibrobacter succinogenes major paralogous domain-containing protein [Salinivirgaceae bacterium]